MSEKEENILIFECPECGHKVEIPGCRTCKHHYRNMENYEEAKECWECDMFHKNYEKEGKV